MSHRLATEQKTEAVLRALDECYGRKRPSGGRAPLEVLVGGILSQNTTDLNSGRAYRALMEQFGDWRGVARAGQRRIARAIRAGGLAEQKAATIKSVMQWLEERGDYSLEFLNGLDDREAEEQLMAIKGVGVKTARLVLLFGLGRPVFVVDTHVHRVAGRLGLLPARCSRRKAHDLLDDLIPDRDKYSAHMNMIAHGRARCKARRPQCEGCSVRRWCVHTHGTA